MDELRKLNANIRGLVEGLKGSIDKLGGTIGREVKSAFSDEMEETYELFKSGADSALGFGSSVLGFFFKSFQTDKKMLSLTEKQNKIMAASLAIDKQEMRDRRKAIVKKEGSFLDFVMVPLIAAGALLGGFLRKLVLPFEMLWKALAPLKLLGRLPFVGRLIEFVKSAGIWIAEITKLRPLLGKIGELTKLATEALSKMPILGKLFRVLRWGFGKLGVYAQIVFSAFDFIEGYMDTQGDILDKIKGGIKNVIFRFVEFPVQLMGYLWNWIDSTFLGGSKGYQETADKFVAVWKKGLDAVFDFFSVKTFDRAWEGIKEIYASFALEVKSIWDSVAAKTKILFDYLLNIPRVVGDFIEDKTKEVKSWFDNTWLGDKIKKWDLSEFWKPAPVYVPGKSNADYFAQREKEAKQREEENIRLMKEQNEYLKKIAQSNQAMVDQPSALVNQTNVNQNRSEVSELPARGPSSGINAANMVFAGR